MDITDYSFPDSYDFNLKPAPLKRVFDILFSLILLILFMPVIILMCILIRLETPGNPIFRQTRVGKNGKLFTIYKIRTLYIHHFGIITEQDEPHAYRITSIGKYLRRSKLDELPQLLNIFLGDMSFVGPRPYTTVDFDENLRFQRVMAKPGLTGIAQISGNNLLVKPNIAWLDIWYGQHYSAWVDIKILLLTVPCIINGDKLADPFKLHSQLPVKLS